MSSRAAARRGVVLGVGVDGEAHQLLGLVAHLGGQPAQLRVEVVAVEPARRLGDVGAEVGRALDLGDDLHRGDDPAQVGRHRLLQREQRVAAVLEVDAALVEHVVARG